MQFLDNNQLEESLKELKLKPVSEKLRERMVQKSSPAKVYPRFAIAAILLLTFSTFTALLLKQKTGEEQPIAIKVTPASKADSVGHRYILPKSQELVYIDDQPYHQVVYIVMDREDVEIQGSIMQLLNPREEQYLVPVTIF